MTYNYRACKLTKYSFINNRKYKWKITMTEHFKGVNNHINTPAHYIYAIGIVTQ